ncbi:hypothetical protein [Sulfurimonas sp.]
MAKIDYLKRAAKALELEEYEVNELAKRMLGHLKKEQLSKDAIIKAFFILQDIKERKEQIRIQTTAPLLNFKNKGIALYRGTIVKLHKQGLSTYKIFDTLKRKKDAPSHSTIKRYLKTLKEKGYING